MAGPQSQITTAVSDLFLALSCLYCIKLIMNGRSQDSHKQFIYAKAGFILIFIPAALGTFRFGLTRPPKFLMDIHKYSSNLAAVVGLSCFAAEFFDIHKSFNNIIRILGLIQWWGALCAVPLQVFLSPKLNFALSECLTASAVVSIAVVSIFIQNTFGIYAVGMMILGGIVGTEGKWFGIPAVDLFHYCLVLSNYFLAWAFLKSA